MGSQKGLPVQCSELCSLPLSSSDGDGRVEAKDGSARGLADSLLIRDLGSWLLPFIVSQALYKLHCLYEPHNRSCKLGIPRAPQCPGSFRCCLWHCGLIPSGFCLEESPFCGSSELPCEQLPGEGPVLAQTVHYHTFTLLPPSGMTSSLLMHCPCQILRSPGRSLH